MTHAMNQYQILSRLLLYPEPELIAHLPQLDAALAAVPEQHALLRPLLAHLESSSLIVAVAKFGGAGSIETVRHSRHLDRQPGRLVRLPERRGRRSGTVEA